jgi:hypothetical protein
VNGICVSNDEIPDRHIGSTPSSGLASSGDGSASNVSDNTQRAAIVQAYINNSLPIVINQPTILPTINSHQRSSSLFQLTSATGFDGESEPNLVQQPLHRIALHTSRSTPGLSRQLTAKISNAFLQTNTVIHRPKLSSRPTVEVSTFDKPSPNQDVTASLADAMANYSPPPSSRIGSSNSPLSQSTAPTSFVSSGAPMSTERPQGSHNPHQRVSASDSPLYEPSIDQTSSHLLVFPRQDAPRLAKPSVATLENAAAAKVFFESHFNQLLGTRSSPRSMRLRQMERKLFAMALPNDQRHQKRRE